MLSINVCNIRLILSGLSPKNEEIVTSDPFLSAHLPMSRSYASTMKVRNLSKGISLKRIRPISVPFLLLSKIIPLLIRQRNFLLHSACLFKGDSLIILTGPSGAGKSSVSAELMMRGFTLVGDDKVVLDENLNVLYGNSTISLRGKDIASRLAKVMNVKIEQSQLTAKFYLKNRIFRESGGFKDMYIFRVRANTTHLKCSGLSAESVTYDIFKDILASFYGFESFCTEPLVILFPARRFKKNLTKILKSMKEQISNNKTNLFYIEGHVANIASYVEGVLVKK